MDVAFGAALGIYGGLLLVVLGVVMTLLVLCSRAVGLASSVRFD